MDRFLDNLNVMLVSASICTTVYFVFWIISKIQRAQGKIKREDISSKKEKSRQSYFMAFVSDYSVSAISSRVGTKALSTSSNDFWSKLIPNLLLATEGTLTLTYIVLLILSHSSAFAQYMQSENFHTVIDQAPSLVLTVLLGALGLLSLCTLLDRTYSAAIGIKEIMASKSVSEKALSAIACCLLAFLFYCTDNAMTYIFYDTESIRVLRFTFSQISFWYFIISGGFSIVLICNIISILTFDDGKLLNKLHRRVHFRHRQINKHLNKENATSIRSCCEYFIDCIGEHKTAVISLTEKQITFVCLPDHFKDFSLILKIYVFIKSLFFTLIIECSACFIVAMFIFENILDASTMILCCVPLSFFIHLGIFVLGIEYRKMYISAVVGTGGFSIQNSKKKKQYFSERHLPVYIAGWNTKAEKYLSSVYNAISFYRDTLYAGKETAKHSLDIFSTHLSSSPEILLTYGLCSHLFNIAYPNDHQMDMMYTSISEHKLNYNIICHNITELTKDVLSDGIVYKCDVPESEKKAKNGRKH